MTKPTAKIKNRIRAMFADAFEIPVKPKTPAITAIIKNTTAQYKNIISPYK